MSGYNRFYKKSSWEWDRCTYGGKISFAWFLNHTWWNYGRKFLTAKNPYKNNVKANRKTVLEFLRIAWNIFLVKILILHAAKRRIWHKCTLAYTIVIIIVLHPASSLSYFAQMPPVLHMKCQYCLWIFTLQPFFFFTKIASPASMVDHLTDDIRAKHTEITRPLWSKFSNWWTYFNPDIILHLFAKCQMSSGPHGPVLIYKWSGTKCGHNS